ncbi:MAG: pyridoxamine 5'-phosphate oxidase [Gammaproteobacteria bacterium RIFCSPLOWO2_02_FULL_61_13]|nr:MAG: pyridoxamine 5'-phosphate oxidase [Gammaproteobacteria bacterium RIFCSPLOWO2_02_FULL_61_13]
MTDNFFEMRLEYRHVSLHEQEASADPFQLFQAWFQAAADHGIEIPNAMVLATADAAGRPSARYVLLKGLDETGFVFFSHAVSEKGGQLHANPRAALVFYWAPMHRQVRVEGNVSEVSVAEADAYFASRPYASQISAWVAPQSSTVTSREFLDQRAAELDRQFAGGPVPRPDTWIGYRVRPERIEFWQGRENRLHDRLCYERTGGSAWSMRRLAP